MFATLSTQGTITIPPEIRHRLKIGTGDRVGFIISSGDVVRLVPERLAEPFAEMGRWQDDSLSPEDSGDAVRACSRVPGKFKGRIRMSDDFDEWPDDIAQALGMR